MPRGLDERKKFSRTSEKVKNCSKRFKTEFTFRNCQITEEENDFRIFPVLGKPQRKNMGPNCRQWRRQKGNKTTHRQDNSPTRFLRQFTDRF